MEQIRGQIVRLIYEKGFGFVRLPNHVGDFFFHRDDFNDQWATLVLLTKEELPEVLCTIVESPKGPRVANVTPIWRDEP